MGVRLRIAQQILFGVVGLPRPDVKAAFPQAPGDHTGFEIRATLKPGRQVLHLDACLRNGTWQSFASATAQVPRRFLPLWLGGGWSDLMFTQVPTHAAHPPRDLRLPRFSAAKLTNAPTPKISIVTPSYQQARFLPETMRSVLDQSGVNCDYVVQDGGSTDGSADLIRQQAPRLHAWSSEQDAGQADAIARGFARTSGGPDDIMAWINSDDFYLPGALAYVAGYFARHPEVDVIYGHRILVDEDSREVARWFLPRHDAEVLRLYDFVPQETLFWRRRIWVKTGGIDPAFNFAIDWDLLLRFQAAGANIVRVPHFLGCFRLHPAQKTSAAMHTIGEHEITLLRERTHGRSFTPAEIENSPLLLRYLRRSALLSLLWRLRLRTS